MGGEQSVIRNLDKRTARREYAGHFKGHITKWKGLQVIPSFHADFVSPESGSPDGRICSPAGAESGVAFDLLNSGCRAPFSSSVSVQLHISVLLDL